MFSFIFSEQFLTSMILFATPILFASFAALISKKAGTLNINVEGSMSLAALTGGLISYATQSWVLGLLSAVIVGVLMSLIFAWFALKLKTDSILSGIALNTLASGLAVYILYVVIGVKGDSSLHPSAMIPDIRIPLLADIPVIGPALFSQNLLVYLVFLSAIVLTLVLNHTRFGMHVRSVGYNPIAASSVGIPVIRTKIYALIICGVFAGLGGAYLSMVYLSYFSVGMVSGRGFIGIAAEAMGQGVPLYTMLFSLFFGAVDYFAVGAQTVLGFPYELLNTLPYIMTLIALVIYAVYDKYNLAAHPHVRWWLPKKRKASL